MSSSIIAPTLPIELTAALFRRADPWAVTSSELAPCMRFELSPTMLAVAAGSNAQFALTSKPSTSVATLATGHVPVDPLQIGAGVPAPHVVPAAANVSPGQAAEVPEQLSVTSHRLTAARHTVPAPASPSGGQIIDVP